LQLTTVACDVKIRCNVTNSIIVDRVSGTLTQEYMSIVVLKVYITSSRINTEIAMDNHLGAINSEHTDQSEFHTMPDSFEVTGQYRWHTGLVQKSFKMHLFPVMSSKVLEKIP
jgi:hypothetical protein